MVDIVTKDNCCYGAVIRREDGTIETVEAEHTVLVTYQTVLVEDAAVPIIAFPEVVLLPVVAHFTEEFHRISVGRGRS